MSAPGAHRERLERLLLKELAVEWRSLNRRHLRGALRPPLLALSESAVRHGHWEASSRTIAISRALVWEDDWRAVCEVLRHEMAHQFVDEVLAPTEESAHGPAFAEACRRLAIDPRASGDLQGADVLADRDGIVRRIRKLLALAGSANRHEAESAMNAAHRLMRKHNIAALDAEERHFVNRMVGPCKQRFSAWEKARAGLVSHHFFVRGIWSLQWQVAQGKSARQLELIGTEENVALAAWVFDFLGETGERLWREHKRVSPTTGARGSYLVGLMKGFSQRLSSEARRCEETGLVWVGDPKLQAHFQQRFPRTVASRGSSLRPNRAAYGAGIVDGRAIVLNKPITSKGGKGTPKALADRSREG